jgi:MarR family transcriptional regulator for hemolysin
MRRDFDRAVDGLGVTGSQWTLLAVVSGSPGATQRTIAEALEMTEAAAGRLIDRMVADGLLERRPKPDDRRAHSIYPTAAAEPVLAGMAAIGAEHEERLLAGLSAADRAELSRLLDQIAANLQA